VFREAADIAYYFHWGREELQKMTGKERVVWLKQINRIHEAQKVQRTAEAAEQAKMLLSAKDEQEY